MKGRVWGMIGRMWTCEVWKSEMGLGVVEYEIEW